MTITYQPNYRVHGATLWLPFGSPISSLSVAVTGLSALTNYDFEVVAGNSFGSATSNVVTASTTTASGGVGPGNVGGTQNTGSTDPIITGPATGTALISGSVAITGITISDAASSSTTAWNPSDASSGFSFANSNLTATSGSADSSGSSGVRSTTSRSTGKLYFEMQIAGTLSGILSIGLADAVFVLDSPNQLGGDADSFGWYPIANPGNSAGQSAYINNFGLTNGTSSDVVNAWIAFAFDFGAKLAWIASPSMRSVSGAAAWNNSATANPATGSGGLSLSTLNVGPYFIATNNGTSGAITTINAGGGSVTTAYTIPTGFTGWDGPSTFTATTTTGTLTSNVGGTAISGNGTTSLTYTGTLANVQLAAANLVLTAPSVVTTANVKVSVFDRIGAGNSITVPISVVSGVAPSPATSLTVTQ